MHIVQVPDSKKFGQKDAEETGLLMGMQQIITVFPKEANGPDKQENIEKKLRRRRPDADPFDETDSRRPVNDHPRYGNILPDRIGKEIDLMAQMG